MLVDFTFENFKCYRDQQAFSMRRYNRSGYAPFDDVSTVTAIYGANASGKSSLLEAMTYAARFAVNGYRSGSSGEGIARLPFLLDSEYATRPSTFYFELIASDERRYKYWFSIDDKQVLSEDLVVYKSSRPSTLFSRWVGDDGSYTNEHGQSIEFGPSFTGPKKQLWSITRENALFLSAAAAGGSKVIEPVYRELGKVSIYKARFYEREMPRVKRELEGGSQDAGALRSLIKFADLGIDDIGLVERKTGVDEENDIADGGDASIAQEGGKRPTDIVFLHEGKDARAMFPTGYESDGTVGALSFFSVALRSLRSGGIALVDEIDSSLHPTLVKELVLAFADRESNPNAAQLIFTTHDVSLIDVSGSEDRVLDRDQIWFASKSDGASEIFPATEFHVRRGENVGRNYLNDVYGALPDPRLHDVFLKFAGERHDGKED